MQMNSELDPTSVVTVSPDQVSCELAGEVVVLSLKHGEYFGLNPVAAEVWNLVQSPRSIAEVSDALLRRFSGVTPEQCIQEVTALVEELRGMELVMVR